MSEKVYELDDWSKVFTSICDFLRDKPDVKDVPDGTWMTFTVQVCKKNKDEFAFTAPELYLSDGECYEPS